MSNKNENSFIKLAKVNIKSKIEKKGNFDYLSWATAWTLLQMEYPGSTRNIYKRHFENGDIVNYFTDGRTCWVSVGITVEGVEHIDELPITDNRNNSIHLSKINSFDINTAIQRATAKAIAMHGLGLHLWIGQDIVNTTAPPKKVVGEEPQGPISLEIKTKNWDKVLKYISLNKDQSLKEIIATLTETKYIMEEDVREKLKVEFNKLVNGK